MTDSAWKYPFSRHSRRGGVFPLHTRDALVALMKHKNTFPGQLADRLQVSRGFIGDVIALRKNLSPEIVAMIGKVLALWPSEIQYLSYCAALTAGWQLPPVVDKPLWARA